MAQRSGGDASRVAVWATAVLAATGLGCAPAWAHIAGGQISGFASGFVHPFLGPDHLVAMFAVGLWGAQMGGRAVWRLPVVFPLIMAFGAALAIAQVPLVAVEPAIALSSLVLGLAILAAWRAPEWVALLLVGFFAIFHGVAHGLELPRAVDPLSYGSGFVVATGLIHVVGIGVGLVLEKPFQGWIARAGGGAIALAGVYFLLL